jgi:hypothetical protein
VRCKIVTMERIDRRVVDPMSFLTEGRDTMKQSQHFSRKR